MIVCPSCGEENPDRFRFCGACGGRLDEGAVAGEEERKVVSVLFADLVGFTARSDQADPEDVRATLRPYHARLKKEIERFGGTVEKFVGDAVMAVFGAPIAHEDDAERAVRAALRINEAVPELNEAHPELELAVRVAVNTGEAVVSRAARPEKGEGFVAGDVVNTASRLQQVAPVGGTVVGEITYRSTKDAINYEELPPVEVKGKAELLAIWRAVSARSRYTAELERAPTPFIGREDDLALLKQTYLRSLKDSSVQLVTVTGEPGVGKSRLIGEFFTFVDDQPELVFWRHGRCLPYGEGITFWALGEIVKAHAGILESDGPEETSAKLSDAIDSIVEEPSQRDWIKGRMAPLVGALVESAGAVEREESFSAWRTFLETAASIRPLVLLIEDIHWADQAMLDFMEHLVDWVTDVPMLVLCSARPELYERVKGWGGGKRNSTTISLPPLSGEETARLISSLLSEAVLPVETQSVLLERSGGNPLYAEEFVRMLTDRGILTRQGRAWRIATEEEIPVPETVQALIAARLDTLAPDRKALLQDASVVGKVFWSGAVSSMSGVDEGDARSALHELARKELVRPSRKPSVRDQAEYSFWHLLIRDVAYAQIPRAARSAKHRAAAEWMEELAGDRVADHAELLAHHYGQALELARASGSSAEAIELEERARRFLVMAGDRAFGLAIEKAYSYYRQALELLPTGHPERAGVLLKAANAAWIAGLSEGKQDFEEALAAAREQGDVPLTGRALLGLARAQWLLGEGASSKALRREAVELLEPHGPSPELAMAYARMAGNLMLSGRSRECLEWSEKALPLTREFGLDEETVRSLQLRGIARCELGDLGGLDDMREALRLGLELGLGYETHTAGLNLGDWIWATEGPAKGLEMHRSTIDFSTRRGMTSPAMWTKAETLWMLYDLGEWDELIRTADEIIEWSRGGGIQQEVIALTYRARVLIERGGARELSSVVEEIVPRARGIGDPQILVPALGVAALLNQALGRPGEAVALIEELHRTVQDRPAWVRTWYLPVALRLVLPEGLTDLAESLMNGIDAQTAGEEHSMLHATAMLAEARGELEEGHRLYAEVARAWAEFGSVLELGHARLGAGRCLLGLGRRAEAARSIVEARSVFQSLGARPAVADADSWIDQAASQTS